MRVYHTYGVAGALLWHVDAREDEAWTLRLYRYPNIASLVDRFSGNGVGQYMMPSQAGTYLLELFTAPEQEFADSTTITVPEIPPYTPSPTITKQAPTVPYPAVSGKVCRPGDCAVGSWGEGIGRPVMNQGDYNENMNRLAMAASPANQQVSNQIGVDGAETRKTVGEGVGKLLGGLSNLSGVLADFRQGLFSMLGTVLGKILAGVLGAREDVGALAKDSAAWQDGTKSSLDGLKSWTDGFKFPDISAIVGGLLADALAPLAAIQNGIDDLRSFDPGAAIVQPISDFIDRKISGMFGIDPALPFWDEFEKKIIALAVRSIHAVLDAVIPAPPPPEGRE